MNTVALIDDHALLRQGLATIVNSFPGFEELFEADNGKDMIEKLGDAKNVTAVLLDVNMPLMNGYETAAWLKEHHPGIKILALSMNDEEDVIMKMLHSGAHGYVLKNTTPAELQEALNSVIVKGFYFNDIVGLNVIQSISKPAEQPFDLGKFTSRELYFIELCSTELNYNEIADKMAISPKTIEFYKDNIEKKTGIRNRISLVRFALKNGIVKL